MAHQHILAGLKGIMPPLATPFDRHGDIDAASFRANLERCASTGVAGVLVAGSTGEAPYLTEAERLRLLETAREVIRPPLLVLAGTGLESTRETIRLSREAVARGADALLVLTPGYYKARMDHAAILTHYRAVADGVRRPVLVYSIPQCTGIRLPLETLTALARHPNIVGLKESSGDLAYLRAVLRRVPKNFRVFTGAAQILLEALRAGAVGGILAQACFAPEPCVAAFEAFAGRRMRLAKELSAELRPLALRVNLAYGVPGIKAAMDLSGYAGGLPRPPLRPLDRKAQAEIAAVLRNLHDYLDL